MGGSCKLPWVDQGPRAALPAVINWHNSSHYGSGYPIHSSDTPPLPGTKSLVVTQPHHTEKCSLQTHEMIWWIPTWILRALSLDSAVANLDSAGISRTCARDPLGGRVRSKDIISKQRFDTHKDACDAPVVLGTPPVDKKRMNGFLPLVVIHKNQPRVDHRPDRRS